MQLHVDKGMKRSIDLSHFKMGDKYINAFASAAKLNYRLNHLVLTDNRITEKSGERLIKNLPENLMTLNLSENCIGMQTIEYLGLQFSVR